eukprot:IDg16007t1
MQCSQRSPINAAHVLHNLAPRCARELHRSRPLHARCTYVTAQRGACTARAAGNSRYYYGYPSALCGCRAFFPYETRELAIAVLTMCVIPTVARARVRARAASVPGVQRRAAARSQTCDEMRSADVNSARCTRARARARSLSLPPSQRAVRARMHACMHACTHARVHVTFAPPGTQAATRRSMARHGACAKVRACACPRVRACPGARGVHLSRASRCTRAPAQKRARKRSQHARTCAVHGRAMRSELTCTARTAKIAAVPHCAGGRAKTAHSARTALGRRNRGHTEGGGADAARARLLALVRLKLTRAMTRRARERRHVAAVDGAHRARAGFLGASAGGGRMFLPL